MSLFIVVGAGPVGRATARLLAAEGHKVRLASRRGVPLDIDGIESVPLDARDAAGLLKIARGAEAIFMCAMAPYHQWPTEFPPIMEGVATVATRTESPLIVLGNVYGYGAAAGLPLTPDLPLKPSAVKGEVRVAMWERALAAGVPTLEVRASDYLGAGAGSLFTLLTLPPLLAGEQAAMVGDPEALHAWSFTSDVARTLVAASRFRGPWGRAFHVPSQHASIQALAERLTKLADIAPPNLKRLTRADLVEIASANAVMGEVMEMAYLFERPCILDASETEQLLGVAASHLDAMILDTLRGARP